MKTNNNICGTKGGSWFLSTVGAGRVNQRDKGFLDQCAPLCLMLAASSVGFNAYAQSDVSQIQEYQRQQERERELRRQQETLPDVRLPTLDATVETEHIAEGESPCFTISNIVLTGKSADHFSGILSAVTQGENSVIGKCLGTKGINSVLSRLQNIIIAKGYVTTRVLAGPQDLKSGTLALTIIPGYVKRIRFANDASERATKWNALPIKPGDMLNLRDLEQGLENFKRVPTADADIQILPSEGDAVEPGDSDLVIQYQQAFPFRLILSVDDGGSDATGKYQGGVTVSYDNWWTLNDLFYVSFNQDLGGGKTAAYGTRSHTVHYSVPYHYWNIGFTSSANKYHQTVAGINQAYIYAGQSDTNEVKASRIIYRDAHRKTSISLKGFLRTSNNFVDDTEILVQRRRTAGWELGIGHKEFIGNSTLDVNLAYRRGTGALSALTAPEETFGEGTSRFKIITADANLAIPFRITAPWGKQSLRYSLYGRGQWNDSPLTPQDKFSIGGRYTVRGFDGEMTLLSERGWFVRNDLGIALGGTGQELYMGLDYGEVAGKSAALLVGNRLLGAVVGMRGAYNKIYYDVFAATPLYKPQKLKTATITAGFSLNVSF